MTWVLKVSQDSFFGKFSSDDDLLQKNDNNITIKIQIKTNDFVERMLVRF